MRGEAALPRRADQRTWRNARLVPGHDGLTLRSVETLEEIGDALVCGSFGRHNSRIGATPAVGGEPLDVATALEWGLVDAVGE